MWILSNMKFSKYEFFENWYCPSVIFWTNWGYLPQCVSAGQYRQIMFMILSSLYSVCKFTQMGHKREKVFHFVFENRPNCKTWSAVSCFLCKKAQSKTFYICLGPFLLHQIFFGGEQKKMHLCLATSRKNWINYFSFEFFWEETAKMVGYFFWVRRIWQIVIMMSYP